MSRIQDHLDAEHAAFERAAERYAELRASVAVEAMRATGLVEVDCALVHRANLAPFMYDFINRPRRGGLSRCPTLAAHLGAVLV